VDTGFVGNDMHEVKTESLGGIRKIRNTLSGLLADQSSSCSHNPEVIDEPRNGNYCCLMGNYFLPGLRVEQINTTYKLDLPGRDDKFRQVGCG
jgi:hypothetical protein